MYYFLVLLCFALLSAPTGAVNCFTQRGARGRCISIKRCMPAILMIKTNPRRSTYAELRKDHCGFEGDVPKICCELQERMRFFDENDNPPTTAATLPPPTMTPQRPTTTPRPTTTSTAAPRTIASRFERHRNFGLLEHKLCGPIGFKDRRRPRIYGGSQTRLFEFPWMALLGYTVLTPNGTETDFRCAGTIVNRHFVMTAAHCLIDLPKDLISISVRVGEYNLATQRDCERMEDGAAYYCAEKHQDLKIEKIITHPDFSYDTLRNDIALIKIKGRMNFRPATVRPVCLPLVPASPPLSTGEVTGWGATEKGQISSDVLLRIRIPVVANTQCDRWYGEELTVELWDKQICAGGSRAKDSCTGDSGGPLQRLDMYRGQARIVQYGIVSFGKRDCALENVPGVYTNVAEYVGWILDNLEAGREGDYFDSL